MPFGFGPTISSANESRGITLQCRVNCDANVSTGCPFVLLAAVYPPVSISPGLRSDYYAALEAADSGNFATWLAFITKQLDEELDRWLEALSEP